MKIELTVCDLGQEVGEPTQSYTVTTEGRSVELDLCQKHAAPLEELLNRGSREPDPKPVKASPSPTAAPKKRAARRPRVVSLAEIEEMKQ
ncbi:DNA binding protein [Streptomyces phage Nanodon]|uniref:DNA binding protein n=1 Tax=Streptomyces phage Nanodon TaxID=1873777 RepID=A0A1B1PA97_9CAUD|nr:DNA binding protein [Streptomyces phage Nanodon]ANT41080.1 DNA binding protein [Streptomyces phage Nanodon]